MRIAYFLILTVVVRKQWNSTFKILRENYFQPRILYWIMLLIKCEGQRYFLECKKKFTNPHFSWGTTGGCTLLKQWQR